MPGDTGVGATITLSGGFTASYREIGAARHGVEDVDNNTLDNPSDSPAKFIPGDNPVYEDIVAQVRFNPKVNKPALRTIQTITITAPKEDVASAAPANLAGTGYVKTWDVLPQFQRNNLNVSQLVLRFDGTTGPIFTPEA